MRLTDRQSETVLCWRLKPWLDTQPISCGRMGRGGIARFHTFRFPMDQRTDKASDRVATKKGRNYFCILISYHFSLIFVPAIEPDSSEFHARWEEWEASDTFGLF